MIPVYWVAQGGKIPENLASTFKSTVYGVEEGVSAGTFALIGLSGKSAIIALVSLLTGCEHRAGSCDMCARTGSTGRGCMASQKSSETQNNQC